MSLMPHWPIYTGNTKQINNINVIKVLNLLDNPHDKMRNIIHITGTNGKGSVASFLHSILMEHGFNVNKYTSPHLLQCNERILHNKTQITDEELYYYIEKVRYVCEQNNIEITIFEATTIAAFLFFHDKDADYNVIEVGMGGDNDATNVFNDNQVSAVVIMPISLDHTKFLGNTKIDILKHKIAISKYNKPLISSSQDHDVANYMYDYCAKFKIPLKIYSKDFEVVKIQDEKNQIDKDYFCLSYKNFNNSGEDELENNLILPIPPLKGDHQLINLATSVITLISIAGFELDIAKLHNGIKKTKWSGRLEQIKEKRLLKILPENSEIFFDGAHNYSGAKALSDYIKTLNDSLNNYIIIGRTKDTDSSIFIKEFVLDSNEIDKINLKNKITKQETYFIKAIFAVKSNGEIKPEHEEVIYKQIINSKYTDFFDENNTFFASNFVQAMKNIVIFNNKFKVQKPVRIFICGSLYMARDIFVLSKKLKWDIND